MYTMRLSKPAMHDQCMAIRKHVPCFCRPVYNLIKTIHNNFFLCGCICTVAAGFPPPMLFRLAVEAAHRALGEWEGSVQVSLAALQLMMGLSQLTIENIGEGVTVGGWEGVRG